jgi:hypothetical protein
MLMHRPNPILSAITEAVALFGSVDNIGTVVSVGTGKKVYRQVAEVVADPYIWNLANDMLNTMVGGKICAPLRSWSSQHNYHPVVGSAVPDPCETWYQP